MLRRMTKMSLTRPFKQLWANHQNHELLAERHLALTHLDNRRLATEIANIDNNNYNGKTASEIPPTPPRVYRLHTFTCFESMKKFGDSHAYSPKYPDGCWCHPT